MLTKLKIEKKIKIIWIFILIILIIIVLCNFLFRETIKKQINQLLHSAEEPINLTTGLINNDYFNISKDGTNSEETTRGINRAIVYAYRNNINNIKLEKGEYLIKIDEEKKGITMYSNISLDLNASILQVEKNSYDGYRTFYIKNEVNIEIYNGVLIGDKNEHDYDSIQSEHQWGYGIHIRGGNNVKIHNLEIYDFIGDGIYIDKYKNGDSSTRTTNTNICNNNIHDCRRQGISIIDGNNIEISSNEIHDINGSSPQSGIDLEANYEDESIENINIFNNKFYNFGRNYAIQVYEGVNSAEICDNEIFASIRINDAKEFVKIERNNLLNGEIVANLSSLNIEHGNKLEKLIINKNILENYNINIENFTDIQIDSNNIKNGNITIKSSNATIINNVIEISNTEEYVYRYGVNDDYYIIQLKGNIVNGNYKTLEIIDDSKYLTIIREGE